jgi:protein-S-isoprenylcysteine O-methyltransferase Ste14
MLLLLGLLVVTKRVATGSVMREKPQGNVWIWLVHIFNFIFLLAVNPVVALLLVARRLEALDPTHLSVGTPRLLAPEIAGLAFYAAGLLLMAWALMTLRSGYQVGGSAPRSSDKLVARGPYRLVRHPMYAAALSIALGLAGLTQSLACLGVFCTYLVVVLLLVPVEEEGLRQAYGEQYAAYQQEVKRLFPFVH